MNGIFKNITLLFLFTLYPFISFYGYNIDKGASYSDLLPFFTIIFTPFAFILLIFSTQKKSTDGALIVLSIFSILYINFSYISQIIPELSYLQSIVVFGFIFALNAYAGYSIFLKEGNIKYLLPIAMVLYATPLYQLGKFTLESHYQSYVLDESSYVQNKESTFSRNPNIYYIVPDAFPRSDTLLEYLGYDNQSFITALQNRNFFIGEQSFANYPITYLSISSTLDMNYVVPRGENTLKSRLPFYAKVQGSNRVVRTLKGQGYTYIHFQNPHWSGSACDPAIADICLKNKDHNNSIYYFTETESTFLQLTPLWKPLQRLADYAAQPGKSSSGGFSIHTITNWVRSDSGKIKTPFFIFAHLLSPHAPYNYNQSCDYIVPTKSTSMNDDNIEKIITQIKCLQKDLLSLVDQIRATDKNDPVIIIQSDHGPALDNPFEKKLSEWNKKALKSRYANLNAIFVDKNCRERLYDEISPVNTFRVIMSCLTSTEPELLQDVSMSAFYENHPEYGAIRVIDKTRFSD